MRFSKEQREGIAKVLDNIATAFIVTSTLGLVATPSASVQFKTGDAIFLLLFSVLIVASATLIRIPIKEIEK